MNPLSLALQPPSLHGLPSHSRSPFAACTRSRSRSSSVSTTATASSHSLLHRHLAPHAPDTKAASDADSTPASMSSQRGTRLSRCTSVSSNLSLLAVQPPCDVSVALSRPDTCSQSDASSALWKAYSRMRMTIAETHTPNPLDTMSEYWHALSTSRPHEQEQSLKHEEEEAFSASCTTMELAIDAVMHQPSSFAPFCVSPAETLTRTSLPEPSANGGLSTGVMLANASPRSVVPVNIAGSGSPSQASYSSNQNTTPSTMAAAPYALVTSSFQAVRSSATEQGRLLAQRSRTSLNRFLDSVLDNATTLAESNTAHESYSEDDEHGSTANQMKTYDSGMKSTRPQLQRQPTSKLKFFVCDESEDDNDDDELSEGGGLAVMASRRSKPATSLKLQADAHDFHYEDFDSQDHEAEDLQEEEEEGDFFGGRKSIATPTSQMPCSGVFSHHRHASPPAALERRQSLLSDLLQAEREQRRQKDLSRCNYLTNFDGEPQIYHPANHHQQQQYPRLEQLERNCPSQGQTTQQQVMTTKPHSPLVRTRKVYSNLDGLALVAMATPPATASCLTTIPTSVSPVASPMSSITARTEETLTAPARGTTITKAAPVAGWSRSHVQVQIQSLVVQSTSTAQRALLNASSTLTDVLFRAAKC